MSPDDLGTFPFGAPVLACGVTLPSQPMKAFVVGAYPSALHVRWVPPPPWRPVAALPVDNEPTPFWDGQGADQQFARWQEGFDPRWGTVTPSVLNGSSGRELEHRFLRPLGITRDDALIVDCLPDARSSVGVRKRLDDTYDAFARAVGAPLAQLRANPSENQIVSEALTHHVQRLRSQIEAARPDVIVSLGNAAARVVAALSGQPDELGVLVSDTYGHERSASVGGRVIAWQALIHPAAPARWQDRHDAWLRRGVDPA